MRDKFEYPKSVDVQSKHDLCGYGSNRVYKLSKDEALRISKEFELPTDFRKSHDETEYDFYYLNHGHGKQHLVFFLEKQK